MVATWMIVAVSAVYLSVLFALAHWGDRLAAHPDKAGPLGRFVNRRQVRATTYGLTLAVYCTTWTFYGSVGVAATTGYHFLPIYLGPILMLCLGYPLFRRLLAVSKQHRITSIADFLAARYGKSQMIGVIATAIAVVGALPYIALQLKAIANSFTILTDGVAGADTFADPVATPILSDTAFIVTILMMVFTVLFGTRHVESTEHHRGMMLAIAFESIVKLLAFLAVGFVITFGFFDGPRALFSQVAADPELASVFTSGINGVNFVATTVLAALAFLCLPRQFHVTVVENANQNDLRPALWLFPLYLVLINLFVVPIAMAGLVMFEGRSELGDAFVLLLPLQSGDIGLALFVFIGGLSAATAMVIVATIALSTMVCNHVIVPMLLREASVDPSVAANERSLKAIRRVSIAVILLLSYAYYRFLTDEQALAAIGLLSFAAASQFAPALIGGLIWKRGTRQGALLGMMMGFFIWGYTLLLPVMVRAGAVPNQWFDQGLFGNTLLHPEHLFGVAGLDGLSHGIIWSLSFNVAFYVVFSLLSDRRQVDWVQAKSFVEADADRQAALDAEFQSVSRADLFRLAQRFMGADRAIRAFQAQSEIFGTDFLSKENADPNQIRATERLLAGSIGSASAQIVMGLSLGSGRLNPRGAQILLDEASQAIRFNQDLLHSALENIHQGVSVFDKDRRLTMCNRRYREMLGLPPRLCQPGVPLEEIIRHLAQDGQLGEGEVETLVAARFGELLTMTSTSLDREKASGEVYEIRSDPMPDGGMIVTYTDVTERVRAAEALQAANEGLESRVAERTAELVSLNEELVEAKGIAERANETKSRFVAAAGHDLLQPLNAARLFAAALRERQGDTAAARPVADGEGAFVGKIEASLESLDDLMKALLEISKLDTAVQTPDWADFEIAEVMAPLESEFAAIAEAEGVSLTVIRSTAVVHSDRRLLRRILQNFISNAVRYAATGKVLVGCRRVGDEVSIEVWDTGPGIADADLERIFKEFTRLSPNKTGEGSDAGRRLGLGLAIVERLAGLLEHPIDVRSVPGKGSVFSVRVPRSQRAAPSVEPAPQIVPLPGLLQGVSVLCLDDDEAILEAMTALLNGWGCRPRAVASPAAFFEAFDSEQPDIVIADFHLEADRDGLSVIEAIRNRSGSAVACILATAKTGEDLIARAEALDCPVLSKPLKPARLRALMTNLLSPS
ncbi:MAG: PAS-domain containing protein, partial [Pseudomonadota bacterium]